MSKLRSMATCLFLIGGSNFQHKVTEPYFFRNGGSIKFKNYFYLNSYFKVKKKTFSLAGESIQVDEALFDGLDDLDLDEEDDPDWNPDD